MIICDTGPIFAAADRTDSDHRACVDLFTGLRLAGRRLVVPQTVMAEVGYMLEAKVGTVAEVAFLEAVTEGSFELAALTRADVARLAERLGVDEIATLDKRHFRVVRPRHVDAFVLMPEAVI